MLRSEENLSRVDNALPDVDWALYGWLCFSHRRAVVRALDEPLNPADIKRKARFQNPDLRMSANNVRDVIKLLRMKGVVVLILDRKRAHPRYELTRLGRKLRSVILVGETEVAPR